MRAHLRLASIENCAALGHHDFDSLAQQRYARERNQHDHRSIWLAAATGANPTETEEILAVAELELPLLDNLSTAYLNLCVDPAHRNRGIGSTLLAAAIDTAHKASRNIVISFGYLPANAETSLLAADAVTASTQTAAFLSTAEGVRFPVRHGFKLEQVERLSTLSLADYVAQPSAPPATASTGAHLQCARERSHVGDQRKTWFPRSRYYRAMAVSLLMTQPASTISCREDCQPVTHAVRAGNSRSRIVSPTLAACAAAAATCDF